MSDQPDAGSLPELTPEQESEVRRLLAEARHDEPIPIDVADRLDTVLAGLSRDAGSAELAPVIDLAARRRRRNAAALLAGAAAVIVAGFAIGQGIDVGSNDATDTAGSSDASADRAGGAGDAKAGSPESPHGSSATASQEAAPQPMNPQVLQLTSKHLARDLDDQLRSYAAASADAGRTLTAETFGVVGCTSPPPPNKFGLGDFYPALYDQTPAVLALRAPADGSQRADVLDCDTAHLLASVNVAPR